MYPPQLSQARTLVPHSPEPPPPQQPDGGGLESSLLQLITDNHQSALHIRETTEKAKREAIRNAVRVSDLLVDVVNGGVKESFVNEKRIEMEIRSLAMSVTKFMKLTDQWLSASYAINTAIKEIGDFENWMKTMEFDCKSITAAIQNIHQE